MENIEEYIPTIKIIAKALYKYYSSAFDYDDAIQEGMIAAMKAIESFNSGIGFDLSGYIKLCATRRIIWQACKMKSKYSRLNETFNNIKGQSDVSSSIDFIGKVESTIKNNNIRFDKPFKRAWKHNQLRKLKSGVLQ